MPYRSPPSPSQIGMSQAHEFLNIICLASTERERVIRMRIKIKKKEKNSSKIKKKFFYISFYAMNMHSSYITLECMNDTIDYTRLH
jgi:hypothetical protein